MKFYDCSVSEVSGLLRDAVRGAKLPPFLGEELANAFGLAHDHDLLWEDVRAAFEEPLEASAVELDNTGSVTGDARVIVHGGILVEVAVGAGQAITLPELDAPQLLSLYCRRGEQGFGGRFDISKQAGTGSWQLSYNPDGAPVPVAKLTRAAIPADLYDMLKAMAARVWVPSTPESRTVGAGAGLNDND